MICGRYATFSSEANLTLVDIDTFIPEAACERFDSKYASASMLQDQLNRREG